MRFTYELQAIFLAINNRNSFSGWGNKVINNHYIFDYILGGV